MTREERNLKLKHLITCMKCEANGRECDANCPTQYDAGNMGEIIENLEAISEIMVQEPCEDCISRQAVLDGLASIAKVKARSDAQKSLMGRIMFFVEQLPPVTPKEKTGKWIYTGDYITDGMLKCSSCGYEHDVADRFLYCPNCKAKMIEPQESEVRNEDSN